MAAPAGFDPAEWAHFQQYQRMKQQQRFEQAPSNMPPPAAFPSHIPQYTQHPQYTQYPQYSQNPQYVQQPFPRDSGYGSGSFDNIGQGHGLPGQQPQAPNVQTGHTYGKVTANGNSRVVRGNVQDPTRPLAKPRQHIFGEGVTNDEARMFNGDITSQDFMHFCK